MRTPLKGLIVNADDFGLSASVNRGIIEGHVDGIVSSASLLTNMPGFDDAVRLAARNPELGVGVHLNVVRGEPVSPPETVPSLLGAGERFLGSAWALGMRLLLGGVDEAELDREFGAQVERVLAAGITPTHVDSEKHLHVVPKVFRAAAKVAEGQGIRAIRLPAEGRRVGRTLPPGHRTLVGWGKSALTRALAGLNRRRLKASGLVTTDHFFGIAAQDRLDARALSALACALPPGVCEVTCHPGYVDEELLAISDDVGGYWINRVRELELRALTDPTVRDALTKNDITLMNFGELPLHGKP